MIVATRETESIDRLFLELSQFTAAKTAKEVHLESMLLRANEALRSAMSIAQRDGQVVAWERFRGQLEKVLVEQHQHFHGNSEWNKDESP